MKINNFGPVNMNPYKKHIEKMDKLQKTTSTDKIQISTEALELQKGSRIETERQAKVDELKNKIESGEYQVDPREVAKKMYEFWND
ncbi:anti-sigma-28 factor, FlgM family [Schinkia azotoformans MEV2011]|uniref:Negative regulator of flagellin synthesis n=1 Tax=Schinkia azotoformans MEV2011 TaxID=1348973 RepID=A0A072NTV6_SCHAZ|nr:flagellar biosynthesis anti-sigma factor FlgM [Schinkia azotoformans]KEF40333.1 anti-sigma-28 factor, FlgM family [Schinkia azotoformans MEV2011]MEC1696358.1 flagellar biosynthesis anti-sigma factor FlgM [Schinkia azotoformans]MEC1715528.1 flagellar biosynthesis anti-sigma factor FlgM [Schinkia azotoformans]MEC1724030.1 flagellar biosynthesis anti-sigma factor FlgM [Schinkia azotoformans]MEC1743414.1 flagellar biosynthesis anti-sigma factor FlgM [Schinkia azotoformans]